MMMKRERLKELIETDQLLQAPGVYDGLTARIAANQGFDAVYMTGFGTAAAFGLPDIGLLTMSEMVANAARIAEAVDIPLIADADTGYGNPINVVRTVQEYEKAGIAAIHIEDQTWPKRCGHTSGKSIIETEDMVGKIKAAVDTRKDPNFLIIARTDAIATDGFDKAIERSHRYAEAGADMLFVEAPTDKEQTGKIPELLSPIPTLLNLAPLTPSFTREEIQEMGYSLAIYPGVCLAPMVAACTSELKDLNETGEPSHVENLLQIFGELVRLLGVEDYRALEEKYKA